MPYSNRPSPKESDNELTSLDLMKKLLARGANVNAQLKTAAAVPHEARSRQRHGADDRHDAAAARRQGRRHASSSALLLAKAPTRRCATRDGINAVMAAAGLGTKEEDTPAGRKPKPTPSRRSTLLLQGRRRHQCRGQQRPRPALHGAALKGYDQVVQFPGAEAARALDVKDAAASRRSTPRSASSATAASTAAAPTCTTAPPR